MRHADAFVLHLRSSSCSFRLPLFALALHVCLSLFVRQQRLGQLALNLSRHTEMKARVVQRKSVLHWQFNESPSELKTLFKVR